MWAEGPVWEALHTLPCWGGPQRGCGLRDPACTQVR